MSEIPMIYSSLTAAAASINAVGKNAQNTQQGWKFRSIDDVYNALNPALIAAGLTIIPEVQEKDITTDANGKATTARLVMRYTVYAQDGSSVICSTIGEGKDYGDKACSKAMAIAYKYMAFQLFCIPTEEMRRDDPDFYVPDEQEKVKAEKPKANLAQRAEAASNVVVSKTEKVGIDRKAELDKLAKEIGTDTKGVTSAWKALQAGGVIPSKPSAQYTDDEFVSALGALRANFTNA